jgi:DNA-binding NarL/FixJ family response regulator
MYGAQVFCALLIMKPKLKVLLADDHDVLRAGVRGMLETGGWQVCAEAGNGIEAVRLASELAPDVVVLDLEMEGLDGLSVIRRIKKHNPSIEIVVFTVSDDEFLIRGVLAAGARAFVLKSEGGPTLMQAIQKASEHRPFLTTKAAEAVLKGFLTTPSETTEPNLTHRERAIVRLLAGGSSNKDIAHALGISVKTVETHRARIMRKLGLSSIVKLVRFAVRENFIKP